MDEGTCTTPVHLDREVGTAENDCYMRFIFFCCLLNGVTCKVMGRIGLNAGSLSCFL